MAKWNIQTKNGLYNLETVQLPLLNLDIDNGYFLPGHADGGEDGGSEQQEPRGHEAAQRRVHLMNIVTAH